MAYTTDTAKLAVLSNVKTQILSDATDQSMTVTYPSSRRKRSTKVRRSGGNLQANGEQPETEEPSTACDDGYEKAADNQCREFPYMSFFLLR